MCVVFGVYDATDHSVGPLTQVTQPHRPSILAHALLFRRLLKAYQLRLNEGTKLRIRNLAVTDENISRNFKVMADRGHVSPQRACFPTKAHRYWGTPINILAEDGRGAGG